MNDRFLKLELRLLILRHGRRNVITTMASLGDQAVEDFERDLAAVGGRKIPKRLPATLGELIDSYIKNRPEIAEPFRTLAKGFENRAFLPQLRDVQKFLDRANVGQKKVKSRALAGPLVLSTLAKLSRHDLVQLASIESSSAESDFSLLAKAIMGTSSQRQEDSAEASHKPPKE